MAKKAIYRARVRRVKNAPGGAAALDRVAMVQEAQIKALQEDLGELEARLAAAEAVITVVAGLGMWVDIVDPHTGEIRRKVL